MASEDDLRAELAPSAAIIGRALNEHEVRAFLHYLQLLVKWNEKARLTSLTRPAAVVRLHFLDSLLCLRADIPQGTQLIDIGSGAGFPGLPLKIVRPDLSVTLLESSARKAAFLELAAGELGLDVEVLKERAERAAHEVQWREEFDIATARAVAPLPALCELTLPFVRPGGKAILLKGPSVRGELAAGKRVADLLGAGAPAAIEAALPGSERRVIVVIEKVSSTPPEYPRRPGVPRKKPLAA